MRPRAAPRQRNPPRGPWEPWEQQERRVNAFTFWRCNGPDSALLIDADDDGVLDIAASASFDSAIAIHPGVGEGTFRSALPVPLARAPSCLIAADLDAGGTARIPFNPTGE